jgi:hypothetical protein
VLIAKQNSNIRKDQESFLEIQEVHRRTAIVRGTATLQKISRRRQNRRFGDDFVPDRADFRSILLSTCGISPKFLEILPLHPFEPNMAGGRIDRADIDRPWHGSWAVERSGKAGATLHRGLNDPIQGDRQ